MPAGDGRDGLEHHTFRARSPPGHKPGQPEEPSCRGHSTARHQPLRRILGLWRFVRPKSEYFHGKARPEGDSVGRAPEQPRHRRRRDLDRRGRALAGPAPARAADHALVGLDLDLDEGRFLDAVRRVGLPALGARARLRRRGVDFGALLESGPLGAAVAGRAALLAALALRARLVLLLALAAEQLPRQHGPGRTQPGKLGFQRLDPAPRSLDGFAQPGILPGQRLDRGLLAPRPAQGPAQLAIHARELLRQRPAGGAKTRKPRVRRLPAGLRRLHGLAQPGVLLAQPGDRGLLASRPAKHIAQVSGLVERHSRQRRPERAELGKPGRQLPPLMLGRIQGQVCPSKLRGQRPDLLALVARSPKLRNMADNLAVLPPDRLPVALLSLHGLAQLEVLGLQRCEPVLASLGGRRRRLGKGLRKLIAQARHFPVQAGCACLDLAAQLLRLLDGRVELATTRLEPRLPRTRFGTGGHFGPAQLLATRLRRLRPCPFAFVQSEIISGGVRRGRLGGRPDRAALGQRRVYGEIVVENHHAPDDNAWLFMLPVPSRGLDSVRVTAKSQGLHGSTERLPVDRPFACSVRQGGTFLRIPADQPFPSSGSARSDGTLTPMSNRVPGWAQQGVRGVSDARSQCGMKSGISAVRVT